MIRRQNISFLLSALILMSFYSCVEEIDLSEHGDSFEHKLLVNSLFNSDSLWEVEVLQTLPRFNPDLDNEIITDARVEIFDQDNNHLYDLYHVGDGKYRNDDKDPPSPKRSYSIKVTAPGLHTVTARGFVPEKSSLLINNFSIIGNEDQRDVEVDFEIEDRSKLESYYLWEVVDISKDKEGGFSSGAQLSETWIDQLTNNPNSLVKEDREFVVNTSFGDGTYKGSYSSLDGSRRTAGIGKSNDGSVNSGATSSINNVIQNILKDESSIGLPSEVSNETNQLAEDGSGNGDEDTEKIVYNYELRVMTISKELYNYYSSLEEYYQKRGGNSHSNESSFIFYSNVNNGAGIFAGYSETVIQF